MSARMACRNDDEYGSHGGPVEKRSGSASVDVKGGAEEVIVNAEAHYIALRTEMLAVFPRAST